MNSDSKKSTGNVYRDARLNAAGTDYRFNSREKTAELMNISSAQLMNYELGICKQIPPESVCMMAELYNAPELRSYYCHHQCPIGAIDISPVGSMQLESIALNILAGMNLLNKAKERLIEIAADGQITEDEEEDFNNILQNLDGMVQKAQELKVFAEKQRKKR